MEQTDSKSSISGKDLEKLKLVNQIAAEATIAGDCMERNEQICSRCKHKIVSFCKKLRELILEEVKVK